MTKSWDEALLGADTDECVAQEKDKWKKNHVIPGIHRCRLQAASRVEGLIAVRDLIRLQLRRMWANLSTNCFLEWAFLQRDFCSEIKRIAR